MVSDDRASSIFGEFMSRTAKFEDLVNNIGHQFLTGFCWELEIFKRPHIYKTSDVVDNIIEANQTERMKAYVDAGCRQRRHDVQNMCNIHSCRQGLEDHLTKVKLLLDELQTLKKEAMDIAWMVNDGSSRTFDPNFDDGVEYEGLPLEEIMARTSVLPTMVLMT
ncbi:uncharacterized protein M6B38_299245 [Iris pallida]|uniref:DUF7795 domain-containing protein n=1 Tax=Iris pallida TaxID=29817 RepID=A0AAX6HPJ1_IRIPA|nr:uncharacterized protein M6B38_299245 [Iris pallida]